MNTATKLLGWLSREFDTQCAGDLHDRFKSRLCSGRKSFVKALATQAGVSGNLRHTLGSCNIAECEEKQIWIVCLKYYCHVFSNRFIVFKVSGCIKRHKFELCFNAPLLLLDDVAQSLQQARHHALGRTDVGRTLHINFTLRQSGQLIRVISARDMHTKERAIYEKVD